MMTQMIQSALTVVAEIKPEQVAPLKQLLATMAFNEDEKSLIPFGRLPNVHFARLLVLDEDRDLDNATLPACLVFMSDLDGLPDPFLEDLVQIAPEGLDALYRHCESYPASVGITNQQRLAYLRARTVKADAMYVNTVGRTVQQVKQEAQLREAIEGFLDSALFSAETSATEVRAAIQKFVGEVEGLNWADKPIGQFDLLWKFKEMLHLIAVPVLLILLSPAILVALPVLVVILRVHELNDPSPDVRPDLPHVRALTELEDYHVQNQFTALGYAKPGWFRQFVVTTVLWLVNYGARHIFNNGDLTGVKTIHFARWVFLNQKRRLIFASSYDGSLESYMDDFIDKVAWGLNAVFSNGVGYPRTNWLVADGATDEPAFKHYIRNHQFATDVWYSAYDDLTAANIKRNSKIRAGLYDLMDEKSAQEWLRLM